MLSHYCIVRGDLEHGPRAAYLVHAAGESSPGNLPEDTRAVALQARDEAHVAELVDALTAAGVDHVPILEDDGHLYAIGIRPAHDLARIRRVCSSLPLVR